MATKEVIRQADKKGRIIIPELAGATLIVEKIDDTEFRVKKAEVVPVKALEFHEEAFPVQLSKRDALQFLRRLDKPPAPTRAAIKAAKEFMKDHGQVDH